jgi:hypothetical protein
MISNWNPDVECNKCGDKIHSKYPGQFVSCKCGAISVDQTQYYARYIGDPKDFKQEEPPDEQDRAD